MFSGIEIEKFKQQQTTLETPEEEKLKKYMALMEALQSKDKGKQSAALDKVEEDKYSDRDMYKFCENTRENYSVFKSFMQSPNCILTKGWPAHLQAKGCIGRNLSSLDGNMKHSLYDEYMGAYLYSEYDKRKKNDKANASLYLELACQFNLFQALKSRCIKCQVILSKTKDDRERLLVVGQILHDVDILCKLYGSAGYFYAAKFLLYVGNHYFNLKKDEFMSTASYFHRLAGGCFYSGRELLSNKELRDSIPTYQLEDNEKILAAVCKEGGLQHFGFNSWNAAEDHFLKPIDREKLTTRQNIYSAAVSGIQLALAENKNHSLE